MNKFFNRKASYPTVMLVEGGAYLHDNHLPQLREIGYKVLYASTFDQCTDILRTSDCDVIVFDATTIGEKAVQAVKQLTTLSPKTAIIMVSDTSGDDTGAASLLPPEPSSTQLMDAIDSATSTYRFGVLKNKKTTENIFTNQSNAMHVAYQRMRSAARTTAPTLITGEAGTGKELCARTIHNLGPQSHNAFITLDCAATTPDQFEAELFGSIQFGNGAIITRDGLATLADGGTLFLREICELDLTSQSKLLRFIRTAHVLPIGSNVSHTVNVRIIASSSVPPSKAVSENTLRSELYYELQSLTIRMPNLRERADDIIPLAEQLVTRYAAIEGRGFKSIHSSVEKYLREHQWPGNVHQLMSFLREIVIMHDGPQITLAMLPITAQLTDNREPIKHTFITDRFAEMTLAEVERSAIESAINRHSGSIPRAAQELAVAPSTIYRKMESWKN